MSTSPSGKGGDEPRERASVTGGIRAGASTLARRMGLKKDKEKAHPSDAAAGAGSNDPAEAAGARGNQPGFPSRPFKKGDVYPLIPGKLSFTVHDSDAMTRRAIEKEPNLFFFSSDFHERYEPFCADFGPVNLGVVHSFCIFIDGYMSHKQLKDRTLIYYTEEADDMRTNGAFLICAYMVIKLGYTPAQAWEPFAAITGEVGSNTAPFLAYRDATYCEQDYFLSIEACCEGIAKALSLGWYMPDDFGLEDYEYFDHPSNADLHRVCPKFVAFKGPSEVRTQLMPGVYTFTPNYYSEIFKELGVGSVVRLNEASTYKAEGFTKEGIRHHELEFDDCTVPDRQVVDRFLNIVESEEGSVAVHCKAGLGRTGTLIAIYWMKHFGLTANECIGWLRVVRPGSVIGPQQQYLHWAEKVYMKGGLEGEGVTDLEGPNKLTAEESAALGLAVADAQNQRAQQRQARHG